MSYLQILFLLFIVIFYAAHFQIPKMSSLVKKKEEKIPERVEPKIKFFSKVETKDFLLEDKDEFFSSLDATNRLARGVTHSNEYKTITVKAAYEFTTIEKELLTRCIKNVCDKMYDLPKKVCAKYGMEQEKLWKQALKKYLEA